MNGRGRWKYALLQMKRGVKVMPRILGMTLVLGLLISLFGWQMIKSRMSDEGNSRVKIGVVGDVESQLYLRMGLYYLQNLDESQFSVEFIQMTEEEAQEALMGAKLQAYVVIPDGFEEAVGSYADDKPLRYVSTEGAVGIGSVLSGEIADAVSTLLSESQNSIYGMQTYLRERTDLSEYELALLGDEMIVRYAQMAAAREELFEIELIGKKDELSIIGYFIAAAIVLFLMMWGVCACPLYAEAKNSAGAGALESLLTARGIRPIWQVLGETAGYLTVTFLSVLLVWVVLFAVVRVAGLDLRELGMWNDLDFLKIFLAMIPMMLMFASLQFLIIEASGQLFGSMLAILLGTVLLGYLGGCFYPISYFPVFMQNIAPWMPSGAAREYFGECMLGRFDVRGFVYMMAVFMLATLVSILLRRKKVGA